MLKAVLATTLGAAVFAASAEPVTFAINLPCLFASS